MAIGNSREVRLVIADVDGTLVTKDKILTDRAIGAVQALKDAGIGFSITSGRPPKGMKSVIDTLELTHPIAAFNGGVIVRPDLSVLEESYLPRSVAERVIASIIGFGLDVWLYTDLEWFVRDQGAPHVAREEWTVKFAPRIVPDFTPHLDRVAKIVGVSDDYPLVERCEAHLRQLCGDSASAARSQPYYLDVTHPRANKGNVVTTLAKMLGITPEEIATIGDMPNDVLMFEKSGLSIAMGNASAEVQSRADYVTTSYDDEGFANGIEKFVLRRAAARKAS
jgi:Cof subfamily protein (haloacid dehalogenase superfamily)